MASYVCRVQTLQRSAGRSAVAAAAYRAGQALSDARLAMDFDFAAKEGVEFTEIRAPEGVPSALRDRQALWNAAEMSEARKDAVPAREILLALPHELEFKQRRDLVRAFVDAQVVARGMIADIAMHRPGGEGDQRNFHVHILVTTRRVGPEGFGRKEPAWWSPQQVRDWRAGWADIQNEHLRRHLGPGAPQVSHLSLAEQGLDQVPTVHMGPSATALKRRQGRTDVGDRNHDVTARNRATVEARGAYAQTADRLAGAAPRIETPVDTLVDETRRVRAAMIAERDGWQAEHDRLKGVAAPGVRRIEADFLSEDARAQDKSRGRLRSVEARVERVRARRLGLVSWIRDPARMIWAKHAELNALARVRKAARRAELRLALRREWLRSAAGQSFIAARRQPALDQAAGAARERRTLIRKIRRMDRRIEAAGKTLRDLLVAQELGERQLRVPARSPDATRFIRDVGGPAREAIARRPEPARRAAIARLNRGQGRSLLRTLFPSR